MNATTTQAENLVDIWAGKVAQARTDLEQAEVALGDALERARYERRRLVKAEKQLENAQDLLRRAEELSR